MSDPSEKRKVAPHIVLIAIIVIVILAVLFWPSDDSSDEADDAQATVEPQEAAPPVADGSLDDETEEFEGAPEPEPVQIDPDAEPEPMPEQEAPAPEPMDSSDTGIKESVASLSKQEDINTFLVDEGLLQRFVVSVTNIGNEEMANQQPLKAPEQTFRVYEQAGKEWIDAASYKRYTPYVNMLESMENQELIELYQNYKPQIQEKYQEIGNPDMPFDEVAVKAINELLDTPEVPVPVEVYSDSVAYKYADPQLENLSAPQKQLLRTGPDNMRRIKAKLREIKAMLEDGNGS